MARGATVKIRTTRSSGERKHGVLFTGSRESIVMIRGERIDNAFLEITIRHKLIEN